MATQPLTAGEEPHAAAASAAPLVDIKPLLKRLWPSHAADHITADDIAGAISLFFTGQVSDVQAASLLMGLHFTDLDRRADVLAACAGAMRRAAAAIDVSALRAVVERRGRKEGAYRGGLCDIVGTGGDAHNTFNVSTTASILASAQLLVAKHGNRSSTSKSGSADLVAHMPPRAPVLSALRPDTIGDVYSATNYAFLFAPEFHPGMRFVAPIRRQLPWRTIFNLLGPLANPAEEVLEARVIGVARRELGPVFAEALRLAGARKALVVCGAEELDEVSCAGETLCWLVSGPGGLDYQRDDGDDKGEDAAATATTTVRHFTLTPEDFGMARHPLSAVSGGKEPAENAAILTRLLHGEMARDDPLLGFVLMNAAALLVVSGVCEAGSSALGAGDDGVVVEERGPAGGRWKEGVRRARWAVESGEAWRQWCGFVEVTNQIAGSELGQH